MISIIIVTWNSEEHLSSCLNSVKGQTEKDYELIIVDNASKDKTKEIIRSYGPVIFIGNKDNAGFSAANNQGINAAKGEYVLTLNPDVILKPDYLEKIKAEIEKNERIGMVSGKLMRPAKAGKPSGEVDSRGIYLSNLRRFYDIGSEERKSGRAEERKNEETSGFRLPTSDSRKLIGPCAAAGFYRRKMLEDIKIPLNPPFIKGEGGGFEYFDEDFFAYAEDVDLAWRANIFGWKAAYCPEAVATHFRGGSGINSEWKQYLSFRNRYLMLIKNETPVHFIRYLYLFIIYDPFRFIYLMFRNKYIFKNNCNNSNLMAKAWKKRKLILKN